ncbi:SDR family NAD(P)-dependent oxidoreductase [Lactobacillus crispatus]|uniref:SDR family NAD(P)-dependent oxidoreductase n=1 Tax=Lactobacillus crispatus TaxID=47770 RepID=UPI0022E273F7|nr:SDR family oxidoreductase [Lactobacillus crispatus]
MNYYDNKTILISGATGGIGREVVKKFLNYKCNIILIHRHKTLSSKHFIDSIYDKSANIIEVVIDLTKPTQLKEIENILQSKHLRVNFIINCIGIFEPSLVTSMDLKILKKLISANLYAPINLVNIALPFLEMNNTSRIINVSSVAAKITNVGQGAYAISKSALNTYTKCLAQELSRFKVPVNSISPGFVKTSMSENYEDKFMKQVPLKRFATPLEIASFIFYLTSDQSTYITGENIVIDGGFSI